MKRIVFAFFIMIIGINTSNAQKIFTTQYEQSVTPETQNVSKQNAFTSKVNTFTINEDQHSFIHSNGLADVNYSIISRQLESSQWIYQLINAEGLLTIVKVDMNYKTFNFYASNQAEGNYIIYKNK